MVQKEIAIECLKKLDIHKPYIRRFDVVVQSFGGGIRRIG
jgi:hypothetical protein